ncbi:NAD(P)-dependent oxidoreductase [Seleniivibrio woodruffii]|uniref:NAD-dependent epimerase/dehydratase family protein n=1 Tax=Seleniivibrio woodruffii TaxID=1078050 RepID=UPI0026E92B4F|nr:NAD-dependent epimerase/dehydratase family protein [Seleniivibrio woodruffii]
MIIGKGMMAHAFQKYQSDSSVLIFASGVSDSRENRESAFRREQDLLENALSEYSGSVFVYFSTCSVYDPSMEESHYVRHKLRMEELIRQNHKQFYIFRLPQVVGATGSPTFVNFLFNRISSSESFDVWENATRNLIDSEDVAKIAGYFIDNRLRMNETINIASSCSHPVSVFVEVIEKLLGKKAVCNKISCGNAYFIDTDSIRSVTEHLGISFDEGYNERIIRKYYIK